MNNANNSGKRDQNETAENQNEMEGTSNAQTTGNSTQGKEENKDEMGLDES